MTNQIIIGVLVILLLIGIRSSVRHFCGQGGCCGGGSTVKIKRKRLHHVIREKTVEIEGMSCKHCKERIENTLNAWDGVSAKVDLKKKTATVEMEREISDEQIRQAIERIGYQVTAIR